MFQMSYELQIVLLLDILAFYFNFAAAPSKLKGVRLQIKQNLLNPLPITANFEVIREALKNCKKVDFKKLCLKHLNLDNFINGFFIIMKVFQNFRANN